MVRECAIIGGMERLNEEAASGAQASAEGVEAPAQEAHGEGASSGEGAPKVGWRTFLGAVLLILMGLLGVNVAIWQGCEARAARADVIAQARHVSEQQSKLVVLSIYQRLTSYHESSWVIAWAGIGRVDESEGEICVDLAKAEFRLEGRVLRIVLPQPRVDHETIGLQFDKSQTKVFWNRLGCPDAVIQGLLREAERALTARLESQMEALERDELVMRQARTQAEELLFAFYRQALGPEIAFSLEWAPEAKDGLGELQ